MAGLSVYCFSCNSRNDAKCGDPFSGHRLPYADCSGSYFRTLINDATINFTDVQDAFRSYPAEVHGNATCQKLVLNYGSGNVTFRTCSVGKLNGAETCHMHMKNFLSENVLFCEQCQQNLCNMSNAAHSNFLVLFMTSCTAVFMMSLSFHNVP
ncbi:hypothetical protein B7P43_G04332 [Cryptotermes secundus]|uniref:Uncharacterized protein n=1 Tax=Cryptotermes secundus TaxID=105785 RepID=A0A2J7QW78_9NEOP|nr:hypothetical protein B7P43_G04332 [Cryptotermes secundus]